LNGQYISLYKFFLGGGDVVIDAKAIAMQVAANIAQRLDF
jgi:hypothetical protein